MDAHKEANRRIAEVLVGALIVRPLDSNLTQAELETIVVESGISHPVFREVIHGDWEARDPKAVGKAGPKAMDLMHLITDGDQGYPTELFPISTIASIRNAFDKLDRDFGKTGGKTIETIMSRCPSESPVQIELALGMMLLLNHLRRVEGGFVTHFSFLDCPKASQLRPHPWVQPVKNLLPLVERVFAARQGQSTPATPPIERFYKFLHKQGWKELAEWWAMASREMSELVVDTQPPQQSWLELFWRLPWSRLQNQQRMLGNGATTS